MVAYSGQAANTVISIELVIVGVAVLYVLGAWFRTSLLIL